MFMVRQAHHERSLMVLCNVSLTRRFILMWILVPTDEILSFASPSHRDVANAENAGAQSAKEKYPKEIRPMPFASCVPQY